MTETTAKKTTKKSTAKKSNVVQIDHGNGYNNLDFTDVYEVLNYLQGSLKVPNNRSNDFGGFTYHNVEDINAHLKALLVPIKGATMLPFKIEVVTIGSKSDQNGVVVERTYIKATAILRYRNADGEVTEVSSEGFAEIGNTKAKMDESQMTGGATSYAKKFAFDNMFMIDDMPTADFWYRGQEEQPQEQGNADNQEELNGRVKRAYETLTAQGVTKEELDTLWKECGENADDFLKVARKKARELKQSA